MRQIWQHQVWIVLATSLVLIVSLGTPRLWDDDEAKNSTCASEMLARGDWTVPTFNGELRADKPILLYWFMLASYQALGVNELAARLTSALCGIGTALLTYHLGRRLFGPGVGLWAGLLLSSSLMFGVAARSATPDSLLIFFSTLALWFFTDGSVAAGSATEARSIVGLPPRQSSYVKMYSAMALAALAKGPVGLLLPIAICGLFLLVVNPVTMMPGPIRAGRLGGVRRMAATALAWFSGTFRPARIVRFAWALRPVTGLAVCALVAMPWYVIVGIKTGGEWPAEFFWRHNVARFMTPLDGHHGAPFYHLLSIAAGFFPASVFLLPTALHLVRRLQQNDPAQRGYILAVCWITVYLVVFSVSGTKLPNYITPTYPALALLTGALFERWTSRPDLVSRFWQAAALTVYGLVGLGMVTVVAVAAPRFFPGQGRLWLIGLVPLFGAIVCLAAAVRGHVRAAATSFIASATLFSTIVFGWGLVEVDGYQTAQPLLAMTDGRSAASPRVATYHILRASWVFYARRRLPLLDRPDEVAAHFAAPGPAYLIVENSQLEAVKPSLPADVREIGRVRKFLEPGHFIVLGRPSPEIQSDERRVVAERDYSRRF